jgi:hypothetical protein
MEAAVTYVTHAKKKSRNKFLLSQVAPKMYETKNQTTYSIVVGHT